MTIWLIIMWTTLALTGFGLVYLSTRVCRFTTIKKLTGTDEKKKAAIGGGVVFGLFVIVGICFNFINAVMCVINFTLVWLVCDLLFYIAEKLKGYKFRIYYSGMTAIATTIAILTCGWYLDHNVWRTQYDLKTAKNIGNFKIVVFADSHLGTTFDAEGFAEHVRKMAAEKPDVVFVVGDYVDDDSNKDDMIAATKILGNIKTKYGIYFVAGNHDKGYYGSAYRGFSFSELIAELQKNGIKVLRDEAAEIGDKIYIIGRKDFSEIKEQSGFRLPMSELVKNLDENRYIIVLDHQPADFANQTLSGVDLVISGHTHGGQMFPFNKVGKLIGANDMIYGYEKRGNTDFIVTSGISDWAIKFKTGTKSEYVVINVKEGK